MKSYKARVKWRGLDHPVQTEWKAARPGMRFPAPVQLLNKPNGTKITVQYDNQMLNELRLLQVNEAAFKAIRRIGGFYFNQGGNQQFSKPWNKLLGLTAYIPYPLPKGTKAIAQGIICDFNVVEVIAERSGYCQIKTGGLARLTEVEIGSDKMFLGGLLWIIYPDKKTKQAWIRKEYIERF